MVDLSDLFSLFSSQFGMMNAFFSLFSICNSAFHCLSHIELAKGENSHLGQLNYQKKILNVIFNYR